MKKIVCTLSLLFVMLFWTPVQASDDSGKDFSRIQTVKIGAFSKGSLENWRPKILDGETLYKIVQNNGVFSLRADSRNAASGLIYEISIDLEKTPFLNWSWRIKNKLAGSFNEKEKTGDDYAARIYVVVSGGIFIWNTKAVNYVWAKHSKKFDAWPNAFASDNAKMIALRSGSDAAGTWYAEKRDVRKDFKRFFGKDIRFIDAVVLMSDTDNTSNQVTAFYGDIFFTSQ